MIEQLNALIDTYKEDLVRDTRRLLAFDSVYEDSDVPGQPFGPKIAEALEDALHLGEEMGFKTRNVDGYMGEIDFGEGGKKIGVIAHIDIVPAGDGWAYPPFAGKIIDGKLYGRGSIDDKGPLVASLYAIKAIRESGLPLSNHVRLLIGCDEESGFRCIKYYLDKEEQPWGGFSPDGEFPVIYGEKGIYRFRCEEKWQGDVDSGHFGIVEISGGSRMNVVPEAACAVLRGNASLFADAELILAKYEFKNCISLDFSGDTLAVKAKGLSAHSSMPWQGENANNLLLNYLRLLPLAPKEAGEYVEALADLFADGHAGEAAGIAVSHPEFGPLTLSLGVLNVDANGGSASFDLRYPNLDEREQLWQNIEKACLRHSLKPEKLQDKPGLHIPQDSMMIQSMLKAYRETSGRNEDPVFIGGGTYCRALENFVAYGPLFPGQKELAHERNEYIGIEDLLLCAKIYAQALYLLMA